ncbi:MAG: hypothetical protein KDH99_10640 [Alcanivoracaceae bacterium]|jgi:hypothetical protein|nr:hypothetical protein [Alcanivoracaceae bacterium]
MRILTTLLALVLSLPALAEGNPYLELSAGELRSRLAKLDAVHEESWYQVEVLVFAREGLTTSEYWRLDQRPVLAPENAIIPAADSALLPEQADNLDQQAVQLGAWRTLGEEDRVLRDMLARMEKQGDYRVLFHQAWRQPVRERARAFPLYLTGGEQRPVAATETTTPDALDFGLPPLDTGEANLTANAGMAGDPATDPQAQPALQPELQGMIRLHRSRYLHVEPDLWFMSQSADGQPYWVRINQNRRMRSDELHYLDHPLFGLLVRLTPWKTDQQKDAELLQQALKAK